MNDSAFVYSEKFIEKFHLNVLHDTTYFGIQTRKNPLDLWIYQQLIFAIQPDYIIEIGTYRGGVLSHWHIYWML